MASHVRIGIDLGGTKIEGVALDRDEEVARLRIATPQHDYEGTVRAIVGVVEDLERRVRLECRQAFHDAKLMERILPDIAEVLHVADDPGESAEELEGRAVTLADGGAAGDVPGQPEPEGPG